MTDQRANHDSFVLDHPGGATDTYVLSSTPDEYVYLAGEGQDPKSSVLRLIAPDTLVLEEEFGATTTWRKTPEGQWQLDKVTGPVASGTTSYERDSRGRVVWFSQNRIENITCNRVVHDPGCKGVLIDYTDDRVTGIRRVAYDPQPNDDGLPGLNAGMSSPELVASYTYDANGRLIGVTDPRSGLATAYSYETVAGRTVLATVTPAGELPWRFAYDPTTARLTKVKRAVTDATGTGDATWSIAYDLPVNGAGMPDLSASAAARWGQSTLPTHASAVFDPSHVPAASPTAADLAHAQLWFYTPGGDVTNTAVHGAGRWLVETTWYDDGGGVVQTLSAAGRVRALSASMPSESAQIAAEQSHQTLYQEGRLEEELGPAHDALLTDGTKARVRSRTVYVYDDEAPGLAVGSPAASEGVEGFDVLVEERHTAQIVQTGEDLNLRRVRYEYAPIVSGDGSGWDFGSPTRVKTEGDNGTWATTVTRFDTLGRDIENRQAGGEANPDGSGADPRSWTTAYYTADGSSPFDACDNRPVWDGLVCRTGPAVQPAHGPSLPMRWTVGYNRDGQPTRVEERSGATGELLRTTVTRYDPAGRVEYTSQEESGGNTTETLIGYGPRGLPTAATSAEKTVSTTYDGWGRVATYTDASGATSTTTYTADGLVATFDDGVGTYTYGYDANGERRGLPTSVDVGLATSPDTFSLTYDEAGQLQRVAYPNGLTANRSYNEIGGATALTYSQGDEEILGFSAELDPDGRVRRSFSASSEHTYIYDKLGRLTLVEDNGTDGCTTRAYAFNASSSRVGLTTYGAQGDGVSCQRQTPSSSHASIYDTADRITDAGYTYDELGRTLTVPAGDTAAGATTRLSATYHPNNQVESLAQTSADSSGETHARAMVYELDPTGRVDTITRSDNGAEVGQLRYHFATNSDVPSSISESTDAGATWQRTRYVAVAGLGMVASETGGTTALQLTNLHGDIVATTANVSGTQGVSSYSSTDEYGKSAQGAQARYGWLGAHQRSTDGLGGLILMGARVYNPATGLFLTIDPVVGGTENAFSYPSDPVNSGDPNGDCLILICIHVELPRDFLPKPRPGVQYRLVKRTPHEIGRVAERYVVRLLLLHWGGHRHADIYTRKGGRNRQHLRIHGQRRTRVYDISARYWGGKLYWFEVKGNKGRWHKHQRQFDRRWARRHGFIFYRVTGIPRKKRVPIRTGCFVPCA